MIKTDHIKIAEAIKKSRDDYRQKNESNDAINKITVNIAELFAGDPSFDYFLFMASTI